TDNFCTAMKCRGACLAARGSRLSRLGQHPEALRAASQLRDFEMPAKFRQPPRAWLLNEMRVASVRQHLAGGAGRDREKTEALGDGGKLAQHRIEVIGLDMLEHVDAADEVAALRRAVFGE